MCAVCEKAAEIVVARDQNCSLTPDEIRELVGHFNEAAEEVQVESASEATEGIVRDDQELATEEAWAGEGMIPTGLMAALATFIGGPFVVAGVRPAEEEGERIQLVVSAASPNVDMAKVILVEALEAFDSPAAATGGVAEDGSLISPMIVRRPPL